MATWLFKRREFILAPCSVGQEIENVPTGLLTLLEQFGISALFATDGYEPLVLHIENLGKIASGSLEAVAFILGATAFGTHILLFFHGLYSIMEQPQKKGVKTLLTKPKAIGYSARVVTAA